MMRFLRYESINDEYRDVGTCVESPVVRKPLTIQYDKSNFSSLLSKRSQSIQPCHSQTDRTHRDLKMLSINVKQP